MAAAAVGVALWLPSSCIAHPVGPARTYSKYQGKAVTTARSARSAVETTRLVANAATAGDAFGSYVSVLSSEQEEKASTLQATFDSIQPPDKRADGLREQLDQLLASITDHLAQVRIAARRGHLGDLAKVAKPLAQDVSDLDRFIGEHSG